VAEVAAASLDFQCGRVAAVADGLWSIRLAASGDGAFMADMLVEAVNWSPVWKKQSRRRVLSTHRTGHYIAGWPRDTDLGVIAEADGEDIGAAWLRFHPASDPGYGFVAADVPELTIGVIAHWRARRRAGPAARDRRAGSAGWHPADQPQCRAKELRAEALPVRGLPDCGLRR
jgi:hypothetical protein